MSQAKTFLETIRSQDTAWLRLELGKRTDAIRTLKFDLGFGKVDALKALRTAKRERAQLLTCLARLGPEAQTGDKR